MTPLFLYTSFIIFLIAEALTEAIMFTHSLISPYIFFTIVIANDISVIGAIMIMHFHDSIVEASSSSSDMSSTL